MTYEYKVVPAPAKGEKAKGIKGADGRFAHALERLMNDLGAEGWNYLRADTLPSEERTGLTGHVTNWRSVLVFRRPLTEGLHPGAEDEIPDDSAEAPEMGDENETDDEDDSADVPAGRDTIPTDRSREDESMPGKSF